ncbi:MAG: redoxin domain-containing protein [Pirellulaceae bacterium]
MKQLVSLALMVAGSLAMGTYTIAQEAKVTLLGRHIEDFELQDVAGTPHWLVDADASCTVVLFLGRECPLVRQYVPRLNELQEEFSDRDVRWLAINSNQHDSLAELQHFVEHMELQVPLLKDPGNRIADLFGATRTPEAFLLDESRDVVYHGRIDDQFTYGRQRPAVVTRFLADAIEDVLHGQPVSLPSTEAEGCIIGRVFQAAADGQHAVTYCNQISRILQRNCTSCHRAGEIGPFALDDYDEVTGWAGMIQEVVNERRMPPWHANPEHGTFSNDCHLSEDEIAMINQWVDDGAPKGDSAELPSPVEYTVGWQIGEPDVVIPMSERPYRVPATGTVEYQYFEVDPGFTEDKWVTAAECRLGNRAVIHHIIVGVRGEGDFGRGVHELQSDWIVATAPGSPPLQLPEGYAKLIPANTTLIFQMHYTPNGVATTDISSVGLKFADPDEITHRVVTWKAHNEDFRIPAGDDNHRVNARFRFPRDAELLSLFPHMHLRGKAFRYTATFPDGEQEVLLDVPAYDFNWQNAYRLAEPMSIPSGTRFKCQAWFDNSSGNIANPDPTASVRWGDQTWEEMMIGYFNVAVPVDTE